MIRTTLILIAMQFSLLHGQQVNFELIDNYDSGPISGLYISPSGELNLITHGGSVVSVSVDDGQSWQALTTPQNILVAEVLFFGDGTRVIRGSRKEYYQETNTGGWRHIYTGDGFFEMSQNTAYYMVPVAGQDSIRIYSKEKEAQSFAVGKTIYDQYDNNMNFFRTRKFGVSDSFLYLTSRAFEIRIYDKSFNLVQNENSVSGGLSMNEIEFSDDLFVMSYVQFAGNGMGDPTAFAHNLHVIDSEFDNQWKRFYEKAQPDILDFHLGKDYVYFKGENEFTIVSLLDTSENVIQIATLDGMAGHKDEVYQFDANELCKIDFANGTCTSLPLPQFDDADIESFQISSGGHLQVQRNSNIYSLVSSNTWLTKANEQSRGFNLSSEGDLVYFNGQRIFKGDISAYNYFGAAENYYNGPLIHDEIHCVNDTTVFLLSPQDEHLVSTFNKFSNSEPPRRSAQVFPPGSLLPGPYHQVGNHYITHNQILDLDNYTYEKWVDNVPDQWLYSSDSLIHFNEWTGMGQSFATRDLGKTIIPLSDGPGGLLFKGISEESTFVLDRDNQKLYFRALLHGDYREVKLLDLPAGEITKMGTGFGNLLYASVIPDGQAESYLYKGLIDCSDFPDSDTINVSLCPGESYMGFTENGTYLIDTILIGNCSTQLTVNLNIRATNDPACQLSSVDDIDKRQVIISPNPFSDEIQVRTFDFQMDQVELMDANGQVLHQSNPLSNILNLELDSFSSGVYYLKIKSGKSMYTRKIVKL